MPLIRNIRRKRRARVVIWSTIFAGMAFLAAFKLPSTLRAQVATPPTVTPLGSLKGINTPKLTNLEAFLKTDRFGNVTPQARAAAIALGKALFWDQAGGSDGQACASCHFNAGADSRTKNQVNPGFRSIPQDNNFDAGFSANYQLTEGDFPFHITRPLTNDVVSSQGPFNSAFVDVTPSPCPADQPSMGNICDAGSPAFDTVFDANGRARRVEPRNTPTMINAVFNFRNFWDGRARHEFNGVNPIGDLDPTARVLINCGPFGLDSLGLCKLGNGPTQKVRLMGPARLLNASLASQALGPVTNELEMSFGNRTFAKVGKKLLALPHALSNQMVAPTDSVLGTMSRSPQPGISPDYQTLIKAAFDNRWWGSNQIVTFVGGNDPDGTVAIKFSKPTAAPLTTNQFTQMEFNFSLFWGIAIQMYESTLRADDSAFDRAFDSGDPTTFSQVADANGHGAWGDREKLGLQVFEGKGKCVSCHGGPETTNASVQNVRNEKLERMLMGDDQVAVYDNGFYNTAVTRCAGNIDGACDDIGLGATIGPKNLPLSLSRFFQQPNQCDFGSELINAVTFTGCTGAPLIKERPEEGIAFNLLQPNERVAVDGAFKTPGLRNVELTAPYFHNGGDLTLLDVVNFYDRGGNFGAFNHDNFDPDVEVLGLTDDEKDGLVALLRAMTDDRVRYQKKPFDHPQLFVPNLGTLPAVGAEGSTTPMHTFQDNLRTVPATP
jgi:cytochrome c peroxidase